MDERKEQISRQQQKSRETKENIQGSETHLQKGGYEELSIKNICEEAGVSNGSFTTILRQKMIFFLTI